MLSRIPYKFIFRKLWLSIKHVKILAYFYTQRNAFKEAICGVRTIEDQTLNRGSMHERASVYSANRSSRSPLVRRNENNSSFDVNGPNLYSSRSTTNNGLLGVESIEVFNWTKVFCRTFGYNKLYTILVMHSITLPEWNGS